jgi:hypothetical protein
LKNQTPNWDEVGTLIGRTGESIRYVFLSFRYSNPTLTSSSQRYMKLKKEAGEFTAASGSEDGAAAPTAAATPTPRKCKPKPKAKKAESDDEDEDEGTPLTKKSKQSKKIVKNEDEDEDEA